MLRIRFLKVGYAEGDADVTDTSCNVLVGLYRSVSQVTILRSRDAHQAHESIRVLFFLLGAPLRLLL